MKEMVEAGSELSEQFQQVQGTLHLHDSKTKFGRSYIYIVHKIIFSPSSAAKSSNLSSKVADKSSFDEIKVLRIHPVPFLGSSSFGK